jgi:hypothetical protein
MKKQKQHAEQDTKPEAMLELAVLAQTLLEGKDMPVRLPRNTPKWQLLAAMLLMYTNSVTNYNMKREKGVPAPQPPELVTVMHAVYKIFGQHETHDITQADTEHMAKLAQELANDRDVPASTPKWQLLGALLIAHTTRVMDDTVRRASGGKAKGEPQSLLWLLNRLSPLFEYQGD